MFTNLHPSLRNSFYAIMVVFAFLFIATYHTFKIALSQPNDLVDKNYYQIGLNYEKHISLQKRRTEDGFKFQVLNNFSDIKKGENFIQVGYLKNADKVTGKEISISLERGATNRFNQTILLKEESPGIYSGKVVFSELGKWIVTITSKEENDNFQERKTIFVN